ncbi:MAG: diadenosine tetraphosphate hydrolase, partial [Lysobacteraceae bacterium]
MNDAGFVLDPRLAGDTAPVAELALCRVLRMDDARWPWLILVPRRAGMRELVDLSRADRLALVD